MQASAATWRADDSALDVPTRNLAFQALGDITQQHLPNDSAAWRRWYASNRWHASKMGG